VQQRTQDLSRSLDDLRNAQDRLADEKLARSAAHRGDCARNQNPLNFVNNFPALSAELTVNRTICLRMPR
jgi:hypothetical protein